MVIKKPLTIFLLRSKPAKLWVSWGPMGQGKSTTMKMITCYMAPTSGKILLEGLDVDKDPEEIKKKIGYLPENNPLYTRTWPSLII
jgi:ABC-type multidrug transport system ATPase subunit